VNEGVKAEPWERFYEFTGTTLQNFPLPSALSLARGRELDRLAQELAAQAPTAICFSQVPSGALLAQAREMTAGIRGRMIAVQEELDWEVYGLYGLVEEDLTYGGDD